MSRRRSNQPAFVSLIGASGVAVMLVAGCGEGRSVRAEDPTSPVNTGLSSINESPALALPNNDELMRADRDDEMVRAQIEESARQLSVYFTNLEIDGPPKGNGNDVPPPPTSRTGGAQAQAERQPDLDPGTQPGAQSGQARRPERVTQTPGRTQPNPDVPSGDGGVRVSLLDLAGAEQGEDSAGRADADEETANAEQPAEVEGKGSQGTGAEGATGQPVGNAGDTEDETDPRARRDGLARELADILSELMMSGQDPGASALALASLEMLLPDDTTVLVDEGVLSEPERASIDAVRSLLGTMTSEGELVSPDQVSERLEQIKQQVDRWAGLIIRRAALCTRVDGYGRYETFPDYRFIAGRAHEVVVYTELDRFAQRETTGPDGQPRFGVELSQRLELYHVADDLNTWNRAAETVRDESRNRLRDYYLTNRVFLPANLGVGRYHLKIVMRDLIGEKVAETIIPIEIVAR